MSRIFFTSDQHFSHKNIAKYCPDTRGRFVRLDGTVDLHKMNEDIVKEWNSKVSPDDTVWSLGDWSLNHNRRNEYLQRLNGHILWIRGNHDHQIHTSKGLVLAVAKETVTEIDGIKIFLVHSPYDAKNTPDDTDLVICGHVHNLWQYQRAGATVGAYITKDHQEQGFVAPCPIINVGLDAWDFKMVSWEEVKQLYEEIK